MKWIGLTGGLGTGKSTVSQMFRSSGIPVVDADELAREVVQPGRPALKEIELAFGPGVLSSNGELDRAALGKIVFGDSKKLEKLESILHPRIFEAAEKKRKQLKDLGMKLAVYDVPLLFEKKLQDRYDLIIVVNAKTEQQIERAKLRNGWSEAEVKSRLSAQLPMSEKISEADFVIDNSSDQTHLKNEVDRCVKWMNSQK